MGDEPDALTRRAWELGVETSYFDVEGRLHTAVPSSLSAIVDLLEADRGLPVRRLEPVLIGCPARVEVGPGVLDAVLRLGDATEVAVVVEHGGIAIPPDLPYGCHELTIATAAGDESATIVVAPERMPRADVLDRSAGVFVPAYALWERDRAHPSFAHLADLAGALPALGIDILVTLPLYAAFLDEPFDASPYAPVSRLHWNETYIDDRELPDIGGHEPDDDGAPVDWRSLAQRRRAQLLAAAERGGTDDLDRFVVSRPDVAEYARFRSLHPEPADFGHPRPLVEASHVLAQYLADRQLATIERPGGAALALDLPIGSHPDGYEMWAVPDLFAAAIDVGAPPDSFFAEGQNWGFAPQLPSAGRRSGHRLWRDLVARAGQHASLLRIDHVMGTHRLWWIPKGAPAHEGCYVRYPREEILAVIAAEAAASATTIIGEDLGTVPDEVFRALSQWDMLGLYEEQFHLHAPELPAVPARTVAGIRTHDMPAFTSVAGIADLRHYRGLLSRALGRQVDGSPDGLLEGALERLARSDAYSVVVDFDDLLGETAPHNVPGLVLDTTWRRRLPHPTSEMLADDSVIRRLALIADRRVRS